MFHRDQFWNFHFFVVYINDLEENVAGLISKFTDDTKIGGVADSEEDCQKMQQDIDPLKTGEMADGV